MTTDAKTLVSYLFERVWDGSRFIKKENDMLTKEEKKIDFDRCKCSILTERKKVKQLSEALLDDKFI